MSRIFSLLVIFALLICPFRCMGAFCAGEESAEGMVATCKCCHHASSTEADQQENDPAPDEPGACDSCLCHGALRGEDSGNTDLDLQQIACLPVDLLPLSARSLPFEFLESAAENADLPIIFGWMLRIRFESIVC